MKILYAVQATGNGHISRAKQLLPYITPHGEVDVFLSGSNASLNVGLPIKYKSTGISLFFKGCGTLDYNKTIFNNKYLSCLDDIRKLPVEDYDLILNDFDFITAHAAKLRNVPSIQFGHQASFMSDKTPRYEKKSLLGEKILKYYAPATHYVGLHFKSYDSFIHPPVIKREVLESTPSDEGHITVYLPGVDQECLESCFKSRADVDFHWFRKDVKSAFTDGNIHFHPISNEGFTHSMITSHGVMTGGGFETPAEAMYLGKKLICVPIQRHYEQQCNAAAAEDLGATIWTDIDASTFAHDFDEWYSTPAPHYDIDPVDPDHLMKHIISLS